MPKPEQQKPTMPKSERQKPTMPRSEQQKPTMPKAEQQKPDSGIHQCGITAMYSCQTPAIVAQAMLLRSRLFGVHSQAGLEFGWADTAYAWDHEAQEREAQNRVQDYWNEPPLLCVGAPIIFSQSQKTKSSKTRTLLMWSQPVTLDASMFNNRLPVTLMGHPVGESARPDGTAQCTHAMIFTKAVTN
jgi:hypothetical protein